MVIIIHHFLSFGHGMPAVIPPGFHLRKGIFHGISHMGRVVLGRIEKRIPAMLFVDPV